jgi:AraC-like DNA-binding protein
LLLDLIETFQPLAHHAPVIQEGAHRFERCATICTTTICAPDAGRAGAASSLSPYHFQRQFKAHFHVTPHQMLMAIRLWRAKAFLTHGMPAAEVAAATGLTDQSHLTRAFTRRYGITPVRYQKQVARR